MNEMIRAFVELPTIAEHRNPRARLRALCAPRGIMSRLVEQFLVDGRLRRGKAIWELVLIGLVVALAAAARAALRAGSFGWLIPEAIVLLVVVALCLAPLTSAVTSYWHDRKESTASMARVPGEMEVRLKLLDLKAASARSVAAGMIAPGAHDEGFNRFVVEQIEGLDTKPFDVAQFCLYVLDHPQDRQSLGVLLQVLRRYEQEPNRGDVLKEGLVAVRSILVRSLGETAVAEAEASGAQAPATS
jgi:hypothetical protein